MSNIQKVIRMRSHHNYKRHRKVDGILKHLSEEVAELCLAYGKEDWENFDEELGDVLVICYELAARVSNKTPKELADATADKLVERYAPKQRKEKD